MINQTATEQADLIAQSWADEQAEEERLAGIVEDRPAWDSRLATRVSRYTIRATPWRIFCDLTWLAPRYLFLMGLSFAFTWWRGRVSKSIYQRRTAICYLCPSHVVKGKKTAILRRPYNYRYCKATPDGGCGAGVKCPESILSTLHTKLKLHNFKCPKGLFFHGDKIPAAAAGCGGDCK